MPSMKNPHAMSITKATKVLFSLFEPAQFDIRVQMPFDAPEDSMPEPDLLVCTIDAGKRKPHPAEAILIIEVAETSIHHDRDKALEHAARHVPEYWIVDLNDRCVEVYRDPVPDRTAALGFRYLPPMILKDADSISPLARPNSSVRVMDLLP
jgi:Uma2 family endonuclease